MASFADQSISSFVDALASSEPTPGGGSAAAVVGAIGAALLMMVSGLPRTRTNTDAERAKLAEIRLAVASVKGRMLTLADEDSAAYNRVTAAYRLPKSTEREKDARKQAIGAAMRLATDAPLETLRVAAEAVAHAKVIAQCGNPAAASDLRVALELLEAAAAGASANVEINLPSVDDPAYRKATASSIIELTNSFSERIAAARSALSQGSQSE